MRGMFLFIMGLLFFINANAFADQAIGCFSSGKINVKFVEIDQDGLSFSYVKYQKSNEAIPLLFINRVEESYPEGRPSAFTTEWQELLNGKVNGKYIIMSQGARFYQFDYVTQKGKVVKFSENLGAYNNEHSDCEWN